MKISLCVLDEYIIYQEIASMVLDVLHSMGHDAGLVKDGSADAFDSDLLLLVGDGTHFNCFASMLITTEKRPVTALWQLDPLPPPGFNIDEEKTFLRYKYIYDKTYHWPKPFRSARKLVRWLFERQIENDEMRAFKGSEVFYLFKLASRSAWFRENYPKGWIDHIFAGTSRQEYLNSIGIPCSNLLFEYHHFMGSDFRNERDIGVIFYGTVKNCRRQDNLKYIKDALAAMGINIFIIEQWCFGDELIDILNRAKITLNLNTCPWDIPSLRFFRSIACGSMVVSEPVGGNTFFKNKRDYVQGEINELPGIIKHFIDNEEERKKVVEAAKKRVYKDSSLEKSLSSIIAQI